VNDAATIEPLSPPAVAISALKFRWRADRPWTLIIPEFTLAVGERLFLAGPSGSGKSTLLALIAGLHPITEGRITLFGTELTACSGIARDRFRADHLGVIFQIFNLLPYLSVLDNVMLPCQFSARRRTRAIAAAGSVAAETRRLLAHLDLHRSGLEHRAAAELSVGQQQRVAAARALIGCPELILADEPTSALDADLRLEFVDLLRRECASVGTALLWVSHDRALADSFDRVVELPNMNAAACAG
jgi:putative ABC transport system ATP-binding protein